MKRKSQLNQFNFINNLALDFLLLIGIAKPSEKQIKLMEIIIKKQCGANRRKSK